MFANSGSPHATAARGVRYIYDGTTETEQEAAGIDGPDERLFTDVTATSTLFTAWYGAIVRNATDWAILGCGWMF